MHGDAGDVRSAALDLSGVYADPRFEAETLQRVDDRECAMHSSSGTIERREESVTSRFDLDPAEPGELPTYGVVMRFEYLDPPLVPAVREHFRRANEILEEDGREHAVDRGLRPGAGEELL